MAFRDIAAGLVAAMLVSLAFRMLPGELRIPGLMPVAVAVVVGWATVRLAGRNRQPAWFGGTLGILAFLFTTLFWWHDQINETQATTSESPYGTFISARELANGDEVAAEKVFQDLRQQEIARHKMLVESHSQFSVFLQDRLSQLAPKPAFAWSIWLVELLFAGAIAGRITTSRQRDFALPQDCVVSLPTAS